MCAGLPAKAIDFHMLFLDGVYTERLDGTVSSRWVQEPTSAKLTRLADTLVQRIGRFLKRQGLLERDAENTYLAGQAVDAYPMESQLGHSITGRIAVGPGAGRKGLTLQTLPARDQRDRSAEAAGKLGGFSHNPGVAARANERERTREARTAVPHHRCR